MKSVFLSLSSGLMIGIFGGLLSFSFKHGPLRDGTFSGLLTLPSCLFWLELELISSMMMTLSSDGVLGCYEVI
jgi:hypothetical protein